MIDWYEIAKNNTIKNIAQAIRRQLNLWVGFMGTSGIITPIAKEQPVDKPLCEAFKSRIDHTSCELSYKAWSSELKNAIKTPILLECHAGICGIIAPIRINNQNIAACYASGFVLKDESSENRAKIFKRSKELQINNATVNMGLRELVELTPRELRLLSDLLSQIATTAESLISGNNPKPNIFKPTKHDYSHIIGSSPPLIQLFKFLDKIVESDSTVLITGEPGVGKELVAKAIHFNSYRSTAPFITQNCSALNDSLLDSELFGHKKGAFTGAIFDKPGLFELADKGTFFLDEIADMSPALQVKLLRVLQEGTFTPVGDNIVRKVDVRIIAATNKDLRQMVKDQTFRSDLFYRLNVIAVRVPTLAERHDDIEKLLNYFLEKKCIENGHPIKTLAPEAIKALINYTWPGNVRELENEVERLVVLSDRTGPIPLRLLSNRILNASTQSNPNINININELTDNPQSVYPLPGSSMQETLDNIEKNMILTSLINNQWNKTQTATQLGISRRNLIRKVDRYDLDTLKDYYVKTTEPTLEEFNNDDEDNDDN